MSVFALLLLLSPQESPPGVVFDATTRARILQHSPLPALPPDPTNRVADDNDASRLGWALFYDKRLSKDGSIACATCHDPAHAFTDGRAVSRGLADGQRNTPTLYNTAWQRWYFWDGRADSLWAQALDPLEDPLEMGGSRASILGVVASDELLRANYERVFGTLQTKGTEDLDRAFANVGKSIAAFERKLVSRESAFDRFARALRENDAAAQSAYPLAARRGLALFVGRADCRLCHSGPLFSDGEFHDIGVPSRGDATRPEPMRRSAIALLLKNPFRAAGAFSDAPTGRRALELGTLAETSDLYGQVKTPSLRNVARTAPYMHAGQFETLEQVLRFYSTREGALAPGHHGETILKPLNFTPEETADLLAFLNTLTDESLTETLKRAPPRSALTR
ncbi:MAG: methylamine utilization protein [Planctomycetes bacterium]|nr:methylamine utilization protein [Planctomycetota bacterium]